MNAPTLLPSGDSVTIDQNFWSGAMTVVANGSKIPGTKGGGFFQPVYSFVLPSGAPMQVSAASFGALKVLVNGQPVQYGRKLAAADYLLAALPLLLPILTLGGGIQFGLGVLGFLMNVRTLTGAESTRAALGKVLLQSAAIIVAGLALALVLGGLLLATRR
jgi:hypothetical protein